MMKMLHSYLRKTKAEKNIIIYVNDIPLVQWFRQKAHEWRNELGIAYIRQNKGLKI